MFLTAPDNILQILQINGYWIMFILMVFEGDIVTYLAAFAASLGIFNIFYVIGLSILGDLTGDLLFFLIGKKVNRKILEKWFPKIFRNEKLSSIFHQLENHPWKTLAVIKSIPALPLPGLILTGTSRMPTKKFLFYSLILSLPFTIFPVVLGYYSGVGIDKAASYIKLEGYIVTLIVGVLIIFWFLSTKISTFIGLKLSK